MFLPNYRAWVIVASLVVCLSDLVRDRAHQARRVPARRDREPALVQAFGINVPRMITLTYGFGVGLAALAGVMAAPIYQVRPQMGANLIIVVVRGGRDRRHGLDHGRHRHRLRAWGSSRA